MADEDENYEMKKESNKSKMIKAILKNNEEVEKLINNYLDFNEKVRKEDLLI